MTVDRCPGSTRMHRGHASTPICKIALFDRFGEWIYARGEKSPVVIGLSVVLR